MNTKNTKTLVMIGIRRNGENGFTKKTLEGELKNSNQLKNPNCYDGLPIYEISQGKCYGERK
jgi:hypothetical protein